MAFFDDIVKSIFGGSDQKQKQSGSTTSLGSTKQQQTSIGATSTTKTGATTGAAEQAGTQVGQTTQFTADQLANLDAIINKGAAGQNIYGAETQAAVSRAGTVAENQAARLGSFGAQTKAAQDAAIAAAKQAYLEGTGADINRYADTVGSQDNSTIQLLKEQGQRKMSVELANVLGQLGMQGIALETDAGRAATDAAGAAAGTSMNFDQGTTIALQQALEALGIAKGGVTTEALQSLTSGQTSQQTSELTNVLEAIKNLTATDTSSKGTTQGTISGSDSGSFLNLITALMTPSGRTARA